MVYYLVVFVEGECTVQLVGEVGQGRVVLCHEGEVEVGGEVGEGVEHAESVFDLSGQH